MSNTSSATPAARAHHTNAIPGTERMHTLIIELEDRPGAVDRVVGVLRRRRSLMQAFSLVPASLPEHVRITTQVMDTHVVVEHLVEQIRKIVDVKHVENLDLQQTLARELALIQVDTTQADINTIIDAGQDFGATVIDVTPETVTFEVTGRSERVEQVIKELTVFGVRDIARSGCVAMARLSNDADQ